MSMMIKAGQVRSGGRGPGGRPMGDPGLGGFLKGVGRVAIGAVTGGATGAIAAGARELRGRGGTSSPASTSRLGGGSVGFNPFVAPPPPTRGPTFRFDPSALAPGGAPAFTPITNGTPAIGCPAGHHPNKSSYFLRSGEFVPKGSRCVRNRRRNAMNPRALGKAISRVNAGKAWQSKLSEISTGKFNASGKRKDR